MKKEDIDHLKLIYEHMQLVHNEDPKSYLMHGLLSIIARESEKLNTSEFITVKHKVEDVKVIEEFKKGGALTTIGYKVNTKKSLNITEILAEAETELQNNDALLRSRQVIAVANAIVNHTNKLLQSILSPELSEAELYLENL